MFWHHCQQFTSFFFILQTTFERGRVNRYVAVVRSLTFQTHTSYPRGRVRFLPVDKYLLDTRTLHVENLSFRGGTYVVPAVVGLNTGSRTFPRGPEVESLFTKIM
jgi:hypothetical protein